MELIILLIVVTLLVGLLLGPIAFFKTLADASRIAKVEAQLQRVSIDLNDTRAVCFRLRQELREAIATPPRTGRDEPTESEAATEAVDAAPKPVQTSPAVAEEPKTEHQAPTVEEPEVDTPAEEVTDESEATVSEPAPTTLEILRAYRLKQQNQNEDAEETDDAKASPESPVMEETEPGTKEPDPVVEQSATIEQTALIETTDYEDVTSSTSHIDSSAAEHDFAAAKAEPTRRLTIEEVLAGKVFVWIGAIALVLTAAFLLKLGFDENIITIPVRVIGAGVFGLGLWCVGEWARNRVSLIAQALCGAAVAVLYGTIIAAQQYELLGTGHSLAFGLMGLVTAAAVVLSLRHGPAVAILGMLGGFMLPPILTQNFGPTSGMILYLLAIEVGVLAVTGKRGWFGISAMTLFFTLAWSIGYTLIGNDPHERTLTAMLVLGTAAAYLFHTARIHRDPHASKSLKRRMLGLSIAATCSAIGIIAILVVKGGYQLSDLRMLGLVALGTLVLARIDARQLAMPFVAMGLSLLVLFANAAQSLSTPPTSMFVTLAACFGGLFMLGGYICMWGSKHRRVFALLCAIAGPSFYSLIVFAGHEAYSWHALREDWWPYTLGLAGCYALATLPMLLKRKAEHDWPIALFAVLSFALVCVTLGQALNHPWLAVSLALVSAIAVLIDLKLFIRPLRLAGCIVATGSAVLLVAPGPFDLTIYGSAVFNTLLPMYLLPAIAFGVIAWSAARAGSSETARNFTWLNIAALAAMLLVLIRDIFQPADFNAMGFALYEWSTYATVLLLTSFAAHWVGTRLKYQPILHATRVLVGVGAAIALIGGLMPSNPLFNDEVVGGVTLAAGLLALYAAPAALMWLWSRRPSITESPQLAETLRGIAITLATLFVALQIRNGFQGSEFQGKSYGMFECMAYAVAWLFLGGLMQRYNRLRLHSKVTRIAGQLIFAMGLLTTVASSVFAFNPLLTADSTGGWDLAGRMIVLYALPAVLLWAWSYAKTLADQPIMVSALRSTSIAMLALFVGLQIRNGFQSDDLQIQGVSLYECIAYMVAGLVLGGFIQRLNQRYLKDAVTEVAGQIIFYLGLATALVGSGIIFNPLFDKTAEGGWALVGDMAVLYVLPAALMWLWSRGKTLADQAPLIATLRGSAIAFVAIYTATLIRNGFHHQNLHAFEIGAFECATYGLAWAVFGYAFHAISPRCTLTQTTSRVGRTIFGLGLTTLVLGNAVVLNPLWFRVDVGPLPVLNGLWYLFGPLMIILALLARHARQTQQKTQAQIAGYLTLGLAFMLLSTFVRHGFADNGFAVITSDLIPAERYAYSLAWVLFGGVLLIAGVFTRLDTLRYGSLAVLLLAVGKVFLIDTANLENLYRVFSFFGLGVTLIALGYLYQRLVFKRPPATPTKAQAA